MSESATDYGSEGYFHEQIGEYEQAIECYKRAINIEPTPSGKQLMQNRLNRVVEIMEKLYCVSV